MKTKMLLAIMFILISFSNSVHAQTNVSGLISTNTTWTLAGSPYIVTGNTLVDNGVILSVEPGVVVKFNSLVALQINGQISARGNSNNMIVFTSNETNPTAGNWGFILFNNSSEDASFDIDGSYISGSILEYCVIEYAGGGTNTSGAIMIDNALPFINHCTIQHNKASGINANSLTGMLKITNNEISDNYSSTGGGICIYGGQAFISNNMISDNSALGGGNYGGGGIFTYSNTSEIFNNYISNNTSTGYIAGGGGAGIYIRDGYSTISNNIIRNNKLTDTINGEGGGILIYSSTATISNNAITNNRAGFGGGVFGGNNVFNNIISNNRAQTGGGIHGVNNISNNSIIYNTASNGSAVDPYYNDISGEFNYNTITGNTATGSSPVYTISVSTHPIINFNNIFNNIATYELNNGNQNTTDNLNAKNNWWGTSLDAQIQEGIYDWFDDAVKGIVSYAPYETSIRTDAPVSPPTGLEIVANNEQISLSWIANSESDIAGYKVYWGTTSNYPYENSVDVGNVTSYIITNVPEGIKYATVTAYDNTAASIEDDSSTIVNEKQSLGSESWYSKPFSSEGMVVSERTVKNHFNLYPMPASNIVTLDFDNTNKSIITLSIYNVFGKLIRSELLQENQQQINIDNLSSGIYMVEIKSKEWSAKQKLIIQK